MRFGRPRRFRDVVERQLDLFAEDEAQLLGMAEDADVAWTRADRDETEELYGDYQLFVDAIGERLHQIREAYALTLDENRADEYRAAFDRTASKRFRRYAGFLEGED